MENTNPEADPLAIVAEGYEEIGREVQNVAAQRAAGTLKEEGGKLSTKLRKMFRRAN